MEDFTTTITVSEPPEKVFGAINRVRDWWGNIEKGTTDALGGEFTYRFKKVHYVQHKITELVPNEKVVWHVTDSFLNFAHTGEWTNTDMVFEIRKKGDETEVRFTHVGLAPECECYDVCRKGWTFYIQESLQKLITTGKGEPSTESA